MAVLFCLLLRDVWDCLSHCIAYLYNGNAYITLLDFTSNVFCVCQAARQALIPVLVEGERLRPGLDTLLLEADYVSTSAHFPQVCLL
jgi:hypothetical protein